MTNSRLVSVGIVILFSLFLPFYTSANTGSDQLNIEQKLKNNKDIAITHLNAVSRDFVDKSLSGALNVERNPDYVSLVCLGILDDEKFAERFDRELAELRKNILEAFANYNLQINRMNLGLQVDKDKLELDVNVFADNYINLSNQFIQRWNTQLNDLSSNVKSYGDANRQLLSDIHSKMIRLNSIVDQFKSLEDLTFQFNNLFMVNQGDFLAGLSAQRNDAVSHLDNTLKGFIQQQSSRYANLMGYQELLDVRRRERVRLYGLDFDEAMQRVMGTWYSRAQHDEIRSQINELKRTFYNNDRVRCDNILTSSMDVDGYTRVLGASISQMNRNLQTGISALSVSGSADNVRQSMLSAVRGLYGDRVQKELDEMRRFATEQFSVFDMRLREQREKFAEISEMRKRYDNIRDAREKEDLLFSISTVARDIYKNAVSNILKSEVRDMLSGLGVVMESDEKKEEKQHDNIFVSVIENFASRFSDKEEFRKKLLDAIPRLEERMKSEDASRRILIQQLIEAIKKRRDE